MKSRPALSTITPGRLRRLLTALTASALAALLLVPATAAHAATPTLAVPARTVYMSSPQLIGDPTVGGVLKADLSWSTPSVSPEGGTPTYSYSWTVDGATIPGETGSTYQATAADLGRVVAAYVTVTYDAESTATFRAAEPLRIAAAPRARGFNGDGTLDIFARDPSGRLLLYPTDGRGNWQAPQVIGTGWNNFNLLLSPGDFDSDGTVDVMGRDGQGRLFLYQGNGSGGWQRAIQVGQGWQDFKAVFAAGDFNGDGTNDLMAKNSSDQLVLYPGNGKGGWLQPYVVGWGWYHHEQIFSAGHFSGRNRLGIAARNSIGGLQLFETNRNGWFADSGSTLSWGWGTLSTIGSAGDFNGDGDIDVYEIDRSGQLIMNYGNGAAYLASGLPGNYWKGASVVGWGWDGFNAVF